MAWIARATHWLEISGIDGRAMEWRVPGRIHGLWLTTAALDTIRSQQGGDVVIVTQADLNKTCHILDDVQQKPHRPNLWVILRDQRGAWWRKR